MLQKLWYDRPVRTQLLIAVGAINLLAALVAGAVSIFNTRTATQVEMEASLEVAQRFVGATLKDLAAQNKLDQLDQELPLQLKHLRHVRIMFMDETGNLTIVSPRTHADSTATRYVPAWYAALVRPQVAERSVADSLDKLLAVHAVTTLQPGSDFEILLFGFFSGAHQSPQARGVGGE